MYTSSVFERDLDTYVDNIAPSSRTVTWTATLSTNCTTTKSHTYPRTLSMSHTGRTCMHVHPFPSTAAYSLSYPCPRPHYVFLGWLVVCSYLRSVANGYDGGRGCPDVGRVRERLANYDFTAARAYVPCSPRSLAHVCLWES